MGMRTLDITTTCMVGLLLASFTVLFASRASKMTPTDFASDAEVAYLDDVEFFTGDMIFYQCCPYINFVVNSVWSHVAIVYVVDGVPYVAEVASQSGFTLKPLHDVVLRALWDGTTRVAVRQACGSRRVDPERLRAFLSENLGQRVPYSHEYWRACFDRTFPMLSVVPATNERSPTTFCSHFVATALRECGALSPDTNVHRMLPSDLAEGSSGFVASNGHAYSPLSMLRLRSRKPESFLVCEKGSA